MRLLSQKRAEKRAGMIVGVILLLAVIGASLSSGDYIFGSEAGITGQATLSFGDFNVGVIGMVMAFVALVGIGLIGYAAISNESEADNTMIRELSEVDREISVLSRRLKDIDDNFFGR